MMILIIIISSSRGNGQLTCVVGSRGGGGGGGGDTTTDHHIILPPTIRLALGRLGRRAQGNHKAAVAAGNAAPLAHAARPVRLGAGSKKVSPLE